MANTTASKGSLTRLANTGWPAVSTERVEGEEAARWQPKEEEEEDWYMERKRKSTCLGMRLRAEVGGGNEGYREGAHTCS
jgi:hypothetical protein